MVNSLPQPLRDDLIPAILALNNAHAVELSRLTAAQLEALLDEAFYARQINEGIAFLLAFDQRATYESPNYLWFRQRYRQFVYVDRVVVAPLMRGRGYARALYMNLFAHARQEGHTLVVCEVNRDPPNRSSDAFHAAMRFTEVGRAKIPRSSKTVRYLARALTKSIEASRARAKLVSRVGPRRENDAFRGSVRRRSFAHRDGTQHIPEHLAFLERNARSVQAAGPLIDPWAGHRPAEGGWSKYKITKSDCALSVGPILGDWVARVRPGTAREPGLR